MRQPCARLATTVAVAAGLLMLIVPLCGDGMSAMTPHAVDGVACVTNEGPSVAMAAATTGGSSARIVVGVDPAVDSAVEPLASGVPTLLPADLDMPTPGTGVLFVCVAFLIAVLAVGLWWRRPSSVSLLTVQRDPAIRDRFSARAVPGLTLAELCVLRT